MAYEDDQRQFEEQLRQQQEDFERLRRRSMERAAPTAENFDQGEQGSFAEPAPQVDRGFMRQFEPTPANYDPGEQGTFAAPQVSLPAGTPAQLAQPEYTPRRPQQLTIENYQPSPQMQQALRQQAWEQEWNNASPEHRRGMEQLSLQTRLEEVRLNRQEQMREQRLRAALAELQPLVENGTYGPEIAADLAIQYRTGISALASRRAEAQRIHMQLQDKALKQQMEMRGQQYAVEQTQIARVQSGLGPIYSPDRRMVYTERGWIANPAQEMNAAQQAAAQDRQDRLLESVTNTVERDVERQVREALADPNLGSPPGWFVEPDIARQPNSNPVEVNRIRRTALQNQAEERTRRLIQERIQRHGGQGGGQPRLGGQPNGQGNAPQPNRDDEPAPLAEPQPFDPFQPQTPQHREMASAFATIAQQVAALPAESQQAAGEDLDRMLAIVAEFGTETAMPAPVREEYRQIRGRLQRLPQPAANARPNEPFRSRVQWGPRIDLNNPPAWLRLLGVGRR